MIDTDIDEIRESILAPKFNFGAPAVSVRHMRSDGTLELEHEHRTDGRGLDIERARKVLQYLHRLWRRPIVLHTADGKGKHQQRPSVGCTGATGWWSCYRHVQPNH